MKFNHHTHTTYSDGKAGIEEFVEEALKQGFHVLGFSEHSPLPFLNGFSISEDRLQGYVSDIDYYNTKYQQINLYKSLEFDFIPGISPGFAGIKNKYKLDYAIGGVHLVKSEVDDQLWFIDGPLIETYDDGLEHLFGNNIKKAVGAYYNQLNLMIESQAFDIIAHIDKIKMHNKNRYFTENEKWYRHLVGETLQLIKAKGIIVEINTRGKYKKRSGDFFPGFEIVKKLKTMKIPVTISSDAHQPGEISLLFGEAKQMLIEAGIKQVMVFDHHCFKPVEI